MYDESNNYCEVLISRDRDKKVSLAGNLYIVMAVVTALLAFFVHPFYLLLTVICLVLRWQLMQKADVEFEYQFWGRQLDVEVIYGGEKRKKLTTYQMDDVEIMAREDDPILEDYQAISFGESAVKTRDLTDKDPNGRPVYLMYVRENELVRVRLQPSHEMLRNMWRVAPKAVHIPDEIKQPPQWENGLDS